MSSKTEQTTNAEKVKLPQWLKAEIFEQVLRDSFKDFKGIKTFRAVAGTKPGDNYATIMLRIELEVELQDNKTESVTYMLKTPHDSAAYQETLGNNTKNIFELEREMFTIYVEELKKLYLDVGLEVEFGAKCYKLDIPYDHVLLEDLRPKGFRSPVRQAGADTEHTLAILKKLAQWHAASAVRVATLGPYPTTLTQGLFGDDGKALMSGMTDGMLKYVLKSLKTIEETEVYYDEVKNMEGHIYENVMKLGVVDPNEFNALNHGDCWLSNLMFLHDEETGKLLDSYLVDYQMCKYGSVAQDLLYFLISSPKLEIKVKNFDYHVKYYYDQLIEHLQLLNYTEKLPSLVDIHTALLRYGAWGYATACGVMTGTLLEPTETASFDNIFANTPEADDFRTLLFSGKAYKEHLKVVMPWLQNRGALQCQTTKNNKAI